MEYCRNVFASKIARYIALIFYPIVGLIPLSAGICLLFCAVFDREQLSSAAGTVLALLITLGMAFFIFRFGFKCYTMENRRFLVSDEGITLSDKGNVFYAWDQVYEIIIVNYGASASLQNYQTVICCFLRPRTNRFLYKILRSYVYGVMNQENFVIIDYSPSIVEKLSSVYPKEILDYRSEQMKM